MTFEQFVTKVLSVAKIGKKYSNDPYALENYEELEKLSLKLLEENIDEEFDGNIFERNVYPTPNMSVRTLVVNKDKEILFVKEKSDGNWAVPGGWCDVFVSPRENAVKEIYEEAGIQVEITRLAAVFQRELYKNKFKASNLSEYVFYFIAEVEDVELDIGFEVSEAAFFPFDSLPRLSLKNTQEELNIAWEIYLNNKEVYID